MNKKRNIALILLGEGVLYLVLLVGLPLLTEAVTTCSNASDEFVLPILVYFLPGLVGVWWIVLISFCQREVKSEKIR